MELHQKCQWIKNTQNFRNVKNRSTLPTNRIWFEHEKLKTFFAKIEKLINLMMVTMEKNFNHLHCENKTSTIVSWQTNSFEMWTWAFFENLLFYTISTYEPCFDIIRSTGVKEIHTKEFK